MELSDDPRPVPELVAIGASWGGLDAIGQLLERLRHPLPYALALVQHRHANAADPSHLLARHTSLTVHEADDKDPVTPGTLHLAPPGYHLMVDGRTFALSTDAPVHHSRPSIDVLFESAADSYGPALVGVLLTGANHDGARGLRRVQQRGGVTVVQEPDTAERPAMPRAALAIMTPDLVAPIDGIADHLMSLCRRDATRHDRGMRTGSPDPSTDERP